MSLHGRNAPCPCGSGRKFKHCCLRTTPVKPPVAPLRRAYAPGNRTSALARRPSAPGAEPEISPEAREVMTGFLEEHYRTWPDHPLPALDGHTPRHAARLTTQRAKVEALLKDLENHMDRDRKAGRPAIDLGWLWDDLGLDRPATGSPG